MYGKIGSPPTARVTLAPTSSIPPRRQRILRRRDPLRGREAGARRAAVGPRNLGRRIAERDDVDEAGLHLRAVALDVAADQEVRRRRLIAPGPLVQIRAGARHGD